MAALDEEGLTRVLGRWIDRMQIRAVLERRDRMKQEIDKLVAKFGQSIFF